MKFSCLGKIFLFIVFAVIGAEMSQAAKVPVDWYVVPERAGDFNISPDFRKNDLEEAVDQLLSAQGDSFDEMYDQSSFRKESAQGWYLNSVKNDIGISSGGDVGILALKGRVAVETIWFPKSGTRPACVADKDSLSELEISILTSPGEIREKVRRVVDAAYYSGKVWDPVRMERELLGAVNHVGKMMQVPPDTRYYMWEPEKFRLDLSVSAEGKVLPFISVGGGLRIRFDWKIVPAIKSPGFSDSENESSRSFRELVSVMADELKVISSGHSGFRSETVEVILGMTASGKIGIAKSSFGANGRLYFKVNRLYDEQSPEFSAFDNEKSGSVWVITDSEYSGLLTREDGSPVTPVSKDFLWLNQGLSGEVYEIDREQLRSGLKKAHQMASFFLDRAVRNDQQYWNLKQIKTTYEMSIGGSLSLASLTGSVGVRITYTAQ